MANYIRLDLLRFIHNEGKLGVMFQKGEVIGELITAIGGTQNGPEPAPLSVLIRRGVRSLPGREKEAEKLFETLSGELRSIERVRKRFSLTNSKCLIDASGIPTTWNWRRHSA